MAKQVRFQEKVSLVDCDLQNGSVFNISSQPLVEEDVAYILGPNIFSKLSGERFIHITCINRKRCRLPMREDIIRGFWNVYEEEAWNQLQAVLLETSCVQMEKMVLDTTMSVEKV